MEHLLSSMMLSGHLKAATGLKQTLLHSLRASVHESRARSFFESLLDKQHAVVGRTQVITHRLTVAMGWCMAQQARLKAMLESGGVTRFATADGSPQGGYQYEMSGAITVPNAQLVDLRQKALFLIMAAKTGAEECEQFRHGLDEAFRDLKHHLQLVPTPPGQQAQEHRAYGTRWPPYPTPPASQRHHGRPRQRYSVQLLFG